MFGKTSLASSYIARGSGGEVLWWWWARLSVCLSLRLYVCLSVRQDISGTTRVIFTNVCACCLWPWLGSPQQGDEIPRGRGRFGVFPPHWQCIVTRSLEITSCSRRDHSVAAAFTAKWNRLGRGWRECTAWAKCNLRLPCFCLCRPMKYLGNRWTDLRQIHTDDVFSPSVGQVWRSRKVKGERSKSPGTKRHFSALSAACVRFVFGGSSAVFTARSFYLFAVNAAQLLCKTFEIYYGRPTRFKLGKLVICC